MIYPHEVFAIENMGWKDGDKEPTEQALITAMKKYEADKTVARQVVLDRLGITADEAALLLG